MKQETGNSVPATRKRLSIRLKAGGHSFSPDIIPAEAFEEGTDIEFSVLTHKCTLVPREAFEPSLAESYLAVVGLACGSDERAVYAESEDIAAVMAIADGCAEYIDATFGGRASYTAPLLMLSGRTTDDGRRLHICAESGVVYMTFCDRGRMLMAEALPAAGPDDILYHAEQADAEFGPEAYTLSVSGHEAKAAAKLLRKYFKEVQCE